MSIKQAEKECRAAWEAHPDAIWAWCLHHEIWLETLIEPYQARITYILKHKPKGEQVTRLNNFRPVLSKLPAEIIKALYARDKAREACIEIWVVYDKARVAYDKAREAHVEAWDAYIEAGKAYDKAWDAYREAILANTTKLKALHTKDVPHHTWNGKSIF